MRPFETNRAPFILSMWMIFLPLAIAFLGGAGAGTVFDPIAGFLTTLWSIYGGASVILGLLLLMWVLWSGWRGSSERLNG